MPASIRQPILIIAAGRDEIVSTAAIDEFAMRLRAGSHLIVPGARHELLMEQDRFRARSWRRSTPSCRARRFSPDGLAGAAASTRAVPDERKP